MSKTRDKNATSSRASTAVEQAGANPSIAAVAANELLAAIESLKTEMKQDNDNVRRDISSLQQELSSKLDKMAGDMRGLTGRMDEVEDRVGHVEDVTLELTQALTDCLKRQRGIQNKLTNLESRSRRNNIRIFGMDERENPKSMVQYIADFLRRELNLPADLDLQVQSAHRIPSAKQSDTGKPPRPIIVSFQEYTTKEMILKEAWKKGPIQLSGKTIYFDHDYATEVIQKRKQYQIIKKALKERSIRFQTPYTSIRIHWKEGPRVYRTAHEAGLELRKRGFEVEVPAAGAEEDVEERLRSLLGWQRREERPSREHASSTGLRAKERLREFQRPDEM